MQNFVHESVIPAPVEDVFAFHERADALTLLQPPWEAATVVQPPTSLEVGTVVIIETRIGPLKQRIVAEHVAYEKNVRFEDVMREGPFAHWHHQHLFIPHPRGCVLRDAIEYRAPLGPLGRLADPFMIRPRLLRMFQYRHEVTAREVLSSGSHAA